MKLLIITNNPERASFRQRVGVYLDLLRQCGIESEISLLPKGMFARAKLFRQAGAFDGVFLHKKVLNPLDACLLRKYARRIIYNYDDALMYSDKRPGRYSRSRFVPFRRTVKLSDMVVVGSAYLAGFAEGFNSNVKIVPLGLNIADYQVESVPKADGKMRLVWIGSESTLVYLEELRPVLEKIGQTYENVVLRIIGDTFFELSNMGVEKCKWQKDTRGAYLAGSDIGLAPLPDNNFTQGKCSFKVLEYSAAGLPVVASPVGTNGDHVLDGETGFLANNEQQWHESIVRLIEDEDLRKRMGDRGREHALQYDISVVGKQFCSLVKDCIDAGGGMVDNS